ncbi:expressed unknown protein [Seminavis robusta]|uniref:Uncharacterized protein n=1 Tax=Seminavis robusta TaxID=568900 RepID=A0A9N8DV88_9STRA|nr:expressed unknown protein [Seminavis robusta]|eukprot:Sro396_g134290.1 n/a (684) ;mRNA; f:34280-36331
MCGRRTSHHSAMNKSIDESLDGTSSIHSSHSDHSIRQWIQQPSQQAKEADSNRSIRGRRTRRYSLRNELVDKTLDGSSSIHRSHSDHSIGRWIQQPAQQVKDADLLNRSMRGRRSSHHSAMNKSIDESLDGTSSIHSSHSDHSIRQWIQQPSQQAKEADSNRSIRGRRTRRYSLRNELVDKTLDGSSSIHHSHSDHSIGRWIQQPAQQVKDADLLNRSMRGRRSSHHSAMNKSVDESLDGSTNDLDSSRRNDDRSRSGGPLDLTSRSSMRRKSDGWLIQQSSIKNGNKLTRSSTGEVRAQSRSPGESGSGVELDLLPTRPPTNNISGGIKRCQKLNRRNSGHSRIIRLTQNSGCRSTSVGVLEIKSGSSSSGQGLYKDQHHSLTRSNTGGHETRRRRSKSGRKAKRQSEGNLRLMEDLVPLARTSSRTRVSEMHPARSAQDVSEADGSVEREKRKEDSTSSKSSTRRRSSGQDLTSLGSNPQTSRGDRRSSSQAGDQGTLTRRKNSFKSFTELADQKRSSSQRRKRSSSSSQRSKSDNRATERLDGKKKSSSTPKMNATFNREDNHTGTHRTSAASFEQWPQRSNRILSSDHQTSLHERCNSHSTATTNSTDDSDEETSKTERLLSLQKQFASIPGALDDLKPGAKGQRLLELRKTWKKATSQLVDPAPTTSLFDTWNTALGV